jgi:hypothetical protein
MKTTTPFSSISWRMRRNTVLSVIAGGPSSYL